MTSRHRKEITPLGTLGIGILICSLSLIVCVMLSAVVLYTRPDGVKLLPIVSCVAMLISGGISGFFIGKMKKDTGLFYTSLSSLCLSIVLLILGLIVSKGNISFKVPLNFILYIAVSSLFAFIFKGKKNRR